MSARMSMEFASGSIEFGGAPSAAPAGRGLRLVGDLGQPGSWSRSARAPGREARHSFGLYALRPAPASGFLAVAVPALFVVAALASLIYVCLSGGSHVVWA